MLTPEVEAELRMHWSNDADSASAAASEVVQLLRHLHPEVAVRVLVAAAALLGVPCTTWLPMPPKGTNHAAD